MSGASYKSNFIEHVKTKQLRRTAIVSSCRTKGHHKTSQVIVVRPCLRFTTEYPLSETIFIIEHTRGTSRGKRALQTTEEGQSSLLRLMWPLSTFLRRLQYHQRKAETDARSNLLIKRSLHRHRLTLWSLLPRLSSWFIALSDDTNVHSTILQRSIHVVVFESQVCSLQLERASRDPSWWFPQFQRSHEWTLRKKQVQETSSNWKVALAFASSISPMVPVTKMAAEWDNYLIMLACYFKS